MDLLDALVLGAVEGVTEFLPISSTGHLMVASQLLALPPTEFLKSFEIAIQLGAILAVALLFWRKLLRDKRTLARVALAFVPTAVVGALLYPFIKGYLLENTLVPLVALFLGGAFLIIFERWYKKYTNAEAPARDIGEMRVGHALAIGLAQSVSIIPGVSRAGATIVGGMFAGLSREAAVEFSFLLAIPTMLAATALDLSQSAFSFSGEEWRELALGFAAAFALALAAVKFLLAFVRAHSFAPFGVYRIFAALAFYSLLF